MSLFVVEGIVLGHFDLGERDRIITFFTKERGKVRAVAGNIRGMKSSLSGILDLFSHLNLTIYQGRSLAKIKSARPITTFYSLREDLLKMACASYVGELIHGFSQEEDPNEELFLLLLTTLHLLSKGREEELEILTRVFELRSLALLGYWPNLESCTLCHLSGEELKPSSFSPAQGGILCGNCSKGFKESSLPLSLGTWKLIKALIHMDYDRLHVIRMTPTSSRELKNLLGSHLEYHLEKELRSRKFLEHVLSTMDT